MLLVLLSEQFHLSTQAWGGGPGAKWLAERISFWNSWAAQRKSGRRGGYTEAEETGGDDKDRARRYDSPLSVHLCVCGMPTSSKLGLFRYYLFLYTFYFASCLAHFSLNVSVSPTNISWEYWRYSISSLFWTFSNVTKTVWHSSSV